MIVQLKDNQPTLTEKVEALVATADPADATIAKDKGHNRAEIRVVEVFDARHAVAGTDWEDLISSIIKVTRTISTKNTKTGYDWDTTSHTAFYLSTDRSAAYIFSNAIRSHWGIENKEHYVRDTAFKEDDSRIRVNPGIFARLRSFAYNILQVNKLSSFVQDRYRRALDGEKKLFFLIA